MNALVTFICTTYYLPTRTPKTREKYATNTKVLLPLATEPLYKGESGGYSRKINVLSVIAIRYLVHV